MKPLKQGSTIACFSPSTPITTLCPKRTQRSYDFISSKGYKLKLGRLTNKNDFYRSGSIKDRANELNELIRDPSIDCIISTIGGMNSNSLLPYIDYESFKSNPKVIIGYSDVTAILMAIYSMTGISTFYGPALVASFGEFPPFNELTFNYFQDILTDTIQYPYEYKQPPYWTDEFIDWETQNTSKVQKNNNWITLKDGIVKGRVIIGNLDTLTGIWGTKYMPTIQKGDILFLEDSFKDISTIERSFSLLKCSGVFDIIGGLILGKYEGFDDRGTGKLPYEVVEEILGTYNFPFIANVDCCHTHPMFTIPIGGLIQLDATHQKIELLHSVFQKGI